MAKFTKEIAFGDHTLILETGEVARQADGAVFASMNGTQVLATVVGKRMVVKTVDFSSDSKLPGKILRCRKNTRRI